MERCSWASSWAPTRIKAVLIDNTYAAIASGGYNWENRLEDGYWTYHLDDVWTGVQTSLPGAGEGCQRKGTVRR